jgi:hypothetical protein
MPKRRLQREAFGVVDSTRSFADRTFEMFLGHVLKSAKMQIHPTVGFPNKVPTTFAGLRVHSEERAKGYQRKKQ